MYSIAGAKAYRVLRINSKPPAVWKEDLAMRTRLTLHPDQDGAKQLREQYGDRLVCVRYRYDETKKQRWKTVELIIEKSVWEPPQSKWPADTLVALQVGAQEREVRQQVKAAGGKWNPRQLVWELTYEQVQTLGITDRIVGRAKRETLRGHLLVDGAQKEEPSTSRWGEVYIAVEGK
jgi:hypothetical protein